MSAHAPTTRSIATAAALTAALATSAAPAQASDATLRKAVATQERKLAPLSQQFTASLEDPLSAVGIERFSLALRELRTGASDVRKAVTLQQASTLPVKRGRLAFIAALGDTSRALTTYREALRLVLDDKPAEAKKALTEAGTELEAATADRAKARKVIDKKAT